MKSRLAALALVAVIIPSCHDDEGEGSRPVIRLIKVGEPVVPTNATPPVGLTWFMGFAENVGPADFQGAVAAITALNVDVWNVTEGQVYIKRIVIRDNVAPGALGSEQPVTALAGGLDALIYSDANWDIFPVLGFVEHSEFLLSGRLGRIIGVPQSADADTLLHEAAHLVFFLSWAPGPLLVDEYEDGIQDSECIMETTFGPTRRLCAADNHVAQTSQPTSCWEQILKDYPGFGFAGTHTAGAPAPAVQVDIVDNP